MSLLVTLRIFMITIILASCTSIDMQPPLDVGRSDGCIPDIETPSPEAVAASNLKANIHIAPQVVFIEKPVYIPEEEKQVVAGGTEKSPPASGADSVRKSTEEWTIRPHHYSHAARVYDYYDDQVFEVYCQALRTTDIYLEPGELAVDIPFISDSERWILGAGVNQQDGETLQHIYLKPKEAGLTASMIINTNRRVYHLLLRSYADVYMPIVRWNYKISGMPFVFASAGEKQKETSAQAEGFTPKALSFSEELEYVDPRFLSFNYKVSFSVFFRPSWLPRLVYDDGRKTYIRFPQEVLQMELPGIFENKSEVINYRVAGDLVIIDKLIKTVTVKYKDERITITKKEE